MLPLPPCVPHTGDDHLDNYPNIAALLSMYATIPAFAAVGYVPSITLDELLVLYHTCTRLTRAGCL